MTNATKFCFQRILFLFLFSISISYALDAQKYPSDCFDAYRICALGDYHFANIEGSGSEEDLHLSKTRIKETNSIWLEFTIEQAGDLEFVIVPENQEDDIDFVLYKGDNCSKISPIRVMTSGQIFGAEYFEDCVGQTGLRSDAIDTHEGDGCFDADDNFLKPASLVEGITYYLFINNFNSSEGFSILFSGDDGLEFRNNCENKISLVDIQAYPNPALENITISSETEFLDPVEIVLFDVSGRIVFKNSYENMTSAKQIDVSDFPSGEYYIRVISKGYKGLKSIVKI